MYRRIALTLALALVVIAGAVPRAGAQLTENLGALTGDNAKKYLGPLPDALSGTMNSAIFTSGKVPKVGINFSVGLKVMGVKFDDADRLYTPTDPSGFSGSPVPTVVGGTASVAHTGPGGATLDYPGGFDITQFAFPAPQLNIGSVFGTRAVVRWFGHDFKGTDDFIQKIDFFGVGGQHSLSQYFPGLPLDLAAGVFYQTFEIDDQNAKLIDTKSLHFDVTGSKSFGLLQPYAAVGYDSFKMKASYKSTSNPGNDVVVDFGRRNHAHLTAGLLANLAFVKIHGEANLAATNGLAVGLSFGL